MGHNSSLDRHLLLDILFILTAATFVVVAILVLVLVDILNLHLEAEIVVDVVCVAGRREQRFTLIFRVEARSFQILLIAFIKQIFSHSALADASAGDMSRFDEVLARQSLAELGAPARRSLALLFLAQLDRLLVLFVKLLKLLDLSAQLFHELLRFLRFFDPDLDNLAILKFHVHAGSALLRGQVAVIVDHHASNLS